MASYTACGMLDGELQKPEVIETQPNGAEQRKALPVCVVDSTSLVELSRAQMGFMGGPDHYQAGNRDSDKLDPFGFLDSLSNDRCIVIPCASLERAIKPKYGIRPAINPSQSGLFSGEILNENAQLLHNPSTRGLIEYLKQAYESTSVRVYDSADELTDEVIGKAGIVIVNGDYNANVLHSSIFDIAKETEADVIQQLVKNIQHHHGDVEFPVIQCNSSIRSKFKDQPIMTVKLYDAARAFSKGQDDEKPQEVNRRGRIKSNLHDGGVANRTNGWESHERYATVNEGNKKDQQDFYSWLKNTKKENSYELTVSEKGFGFSKQLKKIKPDTKPVNAEPKKKTKIEPTQKCNSKPGKKVSGVQHIQRESYEVASNDEFIISIKVPDHAPPHTHVETVKNQPWHHKARFLMVDDANDGRYGAPYPYTKIEDLYTEAAFTQYPNSSLIRESDTMSSEQKERARKFVNQNIDKCIDKWREVFQDKPEKNIFLNSQGAENFLYSPKQLEKPPRHTPLRAR